MSQVFFKSCQNILTRITISTKTYQKNWQIAGLTVWVQELTSPKRKFGSETTYYDLCLMTHQGTNNLGFFFFWMGNNLGFNKVLKHRLGSWLTFSSTQITAPVLYLSSQLGSHNHYTFFMQNDEWVENKPMIFWSRGRKWAYSMTRHPSPRLSIGPLSH